MYLQRLRLKRGAAMMGIRLGLDTLAPTSTVLYH